MTWAEFKKIVEDAGVKDDDDIWYIDTPHDVPTNFKKDEDLGWGIW
jgi:hypothetical protein